MYQAYNKIIFAQILRQMSLKKKLYLTKNTDNNKKQLNNEVSIHCVSQLYLFNH